MYNLKSEKFGTKVKDHLQGPPSPHSDFSAKKIINEKRPQLSIKIQIWPITSSSSGHLELGSQTPRVLACYSSDNSWSDITIKMYDSELPWIQVNYF